MPNFTGDQDDREDLQDDGPFANFEPGPLPIAPDGGIQPGHGMDTPEPPPPMDAHHCICLRGPCQHYWEISGPMVSGNPAGTWEHLGIKEPKQFFRGCIFGPQETEFGEFTPSECNSWDPIELHTFRERELRRQKWHDENGIVEEEVDEPSED
jgi:hypothetical protein